MSISVIALALAAQHLGPEVTTFHAKPQQPKQEEAKQPEQAAEAAALAGKPAPPPEPPEPIRVLSVREVAPNAKVVFVSGEGGTPD